MPERGHRLLEHTADAGMEARAPTVAILLEEAASALVELAADVDGPSRAEPERISLEADDHVALAFSWLNELVGLMDLRRQALVQAEVARITEADGTVRLEGTGWFADYGPSIRARRHVKSATLHRLTIERIGGGWRMRAYVDL